MGDYEKYCKSVTPGGGRIIACPLAKESAKLDTGLQEGTGGGREEIVARSRSTGRRTWRAATSSMKAG